MASNIFSGIVTFVADTASALSRDFQQGLDSAREGGVVLSLEADTFSAPLESEWVAEYGVAVCAVNKAEIILDPDLKASAGHDVDSEASEGAIGAIQPHPQKDQISSNDPSHAELLLRTVTQLAKIDFQLARACLEELSDGNVPELSQEQMEYSSEKIRTMLGGDSHTQSRNNEEAVSIARKTLKGSEDLAKSVLRAEIGDSSESGLSANAFVESRLHAGEMLTQNIRKCLQAMFTTLALQLSCCNNNHFMRLKLTGFVNLTDHEKPLFFYLYLSNGYDYPRSSWVESKCTFIRELTQREEKGCAFIKDSLLGKKKLDLSLKETHNQDPTSAMERTQDSLRPIQLSISKESNSLVTPIVSLASLIQQDESLYHIRRVSKAETFLPEERDWLCLHLALSLLHMSGRDWNRATWYSDDPDTEFGLFFLRDPSTQEIVDKKRPYMSWRLHEEPGVQKPATGHRYDVQLLSFARLLIDINKWQRIRLMPEPKSEEELCSGLLSYIDEHFRKEWDKYFISALKACLNRRGCIEAAAKDKPERLQAYIFENIVKPLHRYLGNPELGKSTSTSEPLSNQATLDGSNQSDNTTSIYDTSAYKDEPEEKSSYEEKFWIKMRKFTKTYINPLSKSPKKVEPWLREKVRIAIIDSGVRKEDAFIAAAQSNKQIRGYRNFTSSKLEDYEDQIGHGTMVARLLLEVAPNAELYIAKVSDQKKMPKNQLHCIAEAIKWAVVEWDVDIISISLALSEEHYDIDEQLAEALSPSSRNTKCKLVFAAAGNQGPYERPAWPARKTGVIAIHATDGSGEGAKFNPNTESELNFSTLGKDIKMRWSDPDSSCESKDVYISGSSFATPIAVGIAANVLEFARHKLKLNPRQKDELYSHRGMTKILKAMSRHRGGYDFVHPLPFWEEAFHGCVWQGQRLPHNDPKNICKILNSIIIS